MKRVVKTQRYIFSATDLEKYTLDPNNPQKAIKYYYQVRSNTIHRGKAVTHDFDTMKLSLKELLLIFKELLKESFQHDGH